MTLSLFATCPCCGKLEPPAEVFTQKYCPGCGQLVLSESTEHKAQETLPYGDDAPLIPYAYDGVIVVDDRVSRR